MAKRREPRRKRPDSALSTDHADHEIAAAHEEDTPSQSMQSFAEYLSFRNAVIGLVIIQALVIIILGPFQYQHNLERAIVQGLADRDFQKAYSSLRRMDFWFGRNPDKFVNQEFIPSLIPTRRRSPNTTLRYYIDGALCLVELGRMDEAEALLDRISPQSEQFVLYQRNQWKIAYLRARISLSKGQEKAAMAGFEQALKFSRTPPALNFHVGKLLAQQGAHLEAALYLSQAARHPSYAEQAQPLLQETLSQITL